MKTFYGAVESGLKSEKTSLIDKMKLSKTAIIFQISAHSGVWSEAISTHVRNEYASVDFSTALAITMLEYKRMGISEKLQEVKAHFKKAVSDLDKEKFSKTHEVYAILAQLISLAEEPKGSLMVYNAFASRLQDDFEKAVALAELEHSTTSAK